MIITQSEKEYDYIVILFGILTCLSFLGGIFEQSLISLINSISLLDLMVIAIFIHPIYLLKTASIWAVTSAISFVPSTV